MTAFSYRDARGLRTSINRHSEDDVSQLVPIPCISLWQPWASLVFTAAKCHETRSRRPPAHLVGKRFAIQAAQKRVEPTDPFLVEILQKHLGRAAAELPRGVILGTVRLGGAYQACDAVRRAAGDVDVACGDWSDGRWLWRLDDARLLPEPIPARGSQGWWTAQVPETHA